MNEITAGDDLYDAREDWCPSAGLDVFEEEPTSHQNPLLKLDNVIVSPHMAGNDIQSQIDMGNEAAQSIIDLYKGKWPEGSIVNKEVKETWNW